MSKYLKDENYDAFIAGLLTAGDTHDPESRIKELIGEIGDVWPASVLADPEHQVPEVVFCVVPFLNARSQITHDPALAAAPTIRDRVLEIMTENLNRLPASAVTLTSAQLDADISTEEVTDDESLDESERKLNELLKRIAPAA